MAMASLRDSGRTQRGLVPRAAGTAGMLQENPIVYKSYLPEMGSFFKISRLLIERTFFTPYFKWPLQ